jgi:hypothetical protein
MWTQWKMSISSTVRPHQKSEAVTRKSDVLSSVFTVNEVGVYHEPVSVCRALSNKNKNKLSQFNKFHFRPGRKLDRKILNCAIQNLDRQSIYAVEIDSKITLKL